MPETGDGDAGAKKEEPAAPAAKPGASAPAAERFRRQGCASHLDLHSKDSNKVVTK